MTMPYFLSSPGVCDVFASGVLSYYVSTLSSLLLSNNYPQLTLHLSSCIESNDALLWFSSFILFDTVQVANVNNESLTSVN